MPFLDSIFGRKKPTPSSAAAALAKVEAELRAAPERIKRAEDALRNVADLNDAEHEAAEIELAAAQRAEIRLGAQTEQLRQALAKAHKDEASAALAARAAAAEKRVDNVPALARRYEVAAAEVADIVAEWAEIDAEVAAINYAIKQVAKADPDGVHPPPVQTSTHRFLTEPDTVIPDETLVEERWVHHDDGALRGVSVFVESEGRMMPTVAGAFKRQVERVVPGRTKKGRSAAAPASSLYLPAARLGGSPFWPRKP